MKVYHWPSPKGNFGDDLNLWLWDHLLPYYRQNKNYDMLLGVGTVLGSDHIPENGKILVVGSGAGYGEKPDIQKDIRWDIRCVRGKLTAKALGLKESQGIIDPAVTIADMSEFQGLKTKYKTIFIPHWGSALTGTWETVCKHAGITYVDPCNESKEVIRKIAQSELVVAESMHAAIIADAFRVPWIPVTTSECINSFKWEDWLSSLDLTYQPNFLPLSSPLEARKAWGDLRGIRAEDPLSFSPKSIAKRFARTKLGIDLLSLKAIRELKKISKLKPQLSAEKSLNNKKSEFYEILQDLNNELC